MENLRGSLSDAIEMVSTMDIIEAFDVPYKKKRDKTYILCPGHDDKHFGSCYIDKNDNGYYCYVCSEYVNKWNMVLRLNGNRKMDACEWFFKMAGISPDNDHHEDPYKNIQKIIKRVSVYINNNSIYQDIYSCEKKESPYGRNINNTYLYSESVVQNPLLDLYKTNKPAFKHIVFNLLKNELKKVNRIREFYNKNSSNCVFTNKFGLISYAEFVDKCDQIAAEINKLIVEVNIL